MRTKSESKKSDIIKVARDLFAVQGFERTSMSDIAIRVGGSKATLYNYFSSKEELFLEIMFLETEDELEHVNSYLDISTPDIKAALLNYGINLLNLIYSPKILSIRRLIIAESNLSNLGKICYDKGAKPSHLRLASFLQTAMDAGKLRIDDSSIAASHLLGLLESELKEHYMLCVQEAISLNEVNACTVRAIDVFIRAYGPLD